LLISVLPSIAAEPDVWGPTVDGLRLSVAVVGNSTNGSLQITVNNVGEQPILRTLGHILNEVTPVFRFLVTLIMPDGTERSVPVAVRGRGEQIQGDFQITPLLLYEGRDLHSVAALEDFIDEYATVYVKLFGKLPF
jgi:hypothetical protein